MNKISFNHNNNIYKLNQLFDLNITEFKKFKLIFSRINSNDIVFCKGDESIKRFLKLNFDIVISMYPIYYSYNRGNKKIINTIFDIKNAIDNPSNLSIEKIFYYYKQYSKIPVFFKRKKLLKKEDIIKIKEFKYCIYNLVETVIIIYKYNKIPNIFTLYRFIKAIGIVNQKKIRDSNLNNQIRICYQFLEDNFKTYIH